MEYEHYCLIYGFQCLCKQALTLYFILESRRNINRNKLISLKLGLFLRMFWLQRWKQYFKYLHCNCLQLVFDKKKRGVGRKTNWHGWGLLYIFLPNTKFFIRKEMIIQRAKRNSTSHKAITHRRCFKWGRTSS